MVASTLNHDVVRFSFFFGGLEVLVSLAQEYLTDPLGPMPQQQKKERYFIGGLPSE